MFLIPAILLTCRQQSTAWRDL